MIAELEKHIKGLDNLVKDSLVELDKQISGMDEKNKAIFTQMKKLAVEGKIEDVKKMIRNVRSSQ